MADYNDLKNKLKEEERNQLLQEKDQIKGPIRQQVKHNLKLLCEAKNLTQQKLGEILGVAGKSTVSNYLNPDSDSVPDIATLYLLKEHFGLPLDTLVSPSFDPQSSFAIDNVSTSQHDKFLGVYILYYLSSNKLSPIPNKHNTPALSYAVMAIVKDNAGILSVTKEAYKAYACFSLKSAENAIEIKKTAEAAFSTKDINAVRNIFASRDRYSEGNFELIFQGKLYSLTMTGYSVDSKNQRTTTDKISILGFNPPNADVTKSYIGGGMLCSSVSRGLNKCPCSQIMLASRNSLCDDQQEVISKLQKHHQYFNTDAVANKVIERFRKLKETDYQEADKETLLRSYIKTCIDIELNNNVSQLFYIFENEDQLFYRFLKDCQSNDNE